MSTVQTFSVFKRKFVIISSVLTLALITPSLCHAQTETGSGELLLQPHVDEAYKREYASKSSRYFFAVSKDGWTYGYSFCEDFRCREWDARQVAIRSCQQRSKGVPCYIYADRNSVIWDGPVTIAKSNSRDSISQDEINETSKSLTQQFREANNPDSWTTAKIIWENRDSVSAEIRTQREPGASRGIFILRLSTGDSCTGEYEYEDQDSGNWSFLCSDGKEAKGIFEVLNGARKAVGTGLSKDGKHVSFTLHN